MVTWMSEPRSLIGTSVMFSSCFSLVMVLSLSVCLAAAIPTSVEDAVTNGIVFGLPCGILAGTVAAAFMRVDTQTVNFEDRRKFVSATFVAVEQLGYRPKFVNAEHMSFSPTIRAGVLAGNIAIHIQTHDAIIIGPRVYVMGLLSRLQGIAGS